MERSVPLTLEINYVAGQTFYYSWLKKQVIETSLTRETRASTIHQNPTFQWDKNSFSGTHNWLGKEENGRNDVINRRVVALKKSS